MKTRQFKFLALAVLAATVINSASAHSGTHGTGLSNSSPVHFLSSLDHAAPVIIPILLAIAWFYYSKARSKKGS